MHDKHVTRMLILGAVSLGAILFWSGTDVYADRAGGQQRSAVDPAIEKTKEKGFEGVDFSYDVFGGPPGQSSGQIAQQTMAKGQEVKPKVMAKQAKLLQDRYRLECQTYPGVRMTEGKPGMVFPDEQIRQFPRLERFDVDFDLPSCFLPEFPPPIFLTTHPKLGDVSQGEVLSFDNFDRLFRGLITPVQLDGRRMLVTQFAQEEFNLTADQKSPKPSLGVAV